MLSILFALASGWVSFPSEAPNMVSASPALHAAGRQYARAEVVATVLEAARTLDHVVVVADVGKNGGGKMPPHATHRDGRTVDILMPVVDAEGKPTQFPHGEADVFGYCAIFDKDGRFSGTGWEGKRAVSMPCPTSTTPQPFTIDFGAVARLVRAMNSAAAAHALRVKRVIVAPEYVARVLASDDGKTLDARLISTFVRRPVWTRHDDHVHIEFEKTR